MRPVTMAKVELLVLKSDVDSVLARLGALACFQPCPGTAPKAGGAPALQDHRRRLAEVGAFLGLESPSVLGADVRLPDPEADRPDIEALSAKATALQEEASALEARRSELAAARSEAGAFAGLKLPFPNLDRLSFLSVRIGQLEGSEVPAVRESLGDRALILPLAEKDQVLAMASRKGRFALDTELKRAGFKPLDLPPDFEGVPPELLPGIEAELAALDVASGALAARRTALRDEVRDAWQHLAAAYDLALAIEEVKSGQEATAQTCRLFGWVPRDRVRAVESELRAVAGGRLGLRSYRPEEVETVRDGTEPVPVLLRHRPFVQSFSRLVISYGVPLYGTIDPTPIVAFFFILLFSVMFGDLGQGGVIALAGLVLSRGWMPSLRRFRQFGPIFMGVGAGSMVMGCLVGSFFSYESLLVGPTRAITQALLGHPLDRILTLMPSKDGMGRLFAFFGFTLAVGAIINSLGLGINIINKWRLGKKGEALFGKTGLSGACFFWWALGMGIRAVLGHGPAWFDALGLGIPLLGVLFAEPLAARIEGHHAEGGSRFEEAIKGAVELLESVSYYFSSTLSFLRVGAFALSHTVLSFIVFAMGDLIRERAPGGLLWELLVVLIGNAIILVLEGMIVAIQVVRLNYYEFFSKFLTEIGVEFRPFRLGHAKE